MTKIVTPNGVIVTMGATSGKAPKLAVVKVKHPTIVNGQVVVRWGDPRGATDSVYSNGSYRYAPYYEVEFEDMLFAGTSSTLWYQMQIRFDDFDTRTWMIGNPYYMGTSSRMRPRLSYMTNRPLARGDFRNTVFEEILVAVHELMQQHIPPRPRSEYVDAVTKLRPQLERAESNLALVQQNYTTALDDLAAYDKARAKKATP